MLLVFDLTNRDSFNNLSKWLKDLKENGPEDAILIIVANKLDLEEERQVTHEELEEFTKKKKLDFYEVSAKNGFNVSLLFESIAAQLVKREKIKEENEKENENNLSHNSNTPKKREPKLYINLSKKKVEEMKAKEMEEKVGCC